MSKSFQSAFNVIKGSVPARMDVPDTDFDVCGKKGIADVKAANAKRQVCSARWRRTTLSLRRSPLPMTTSSPSSSMARSRRLMPP